MCKRRPKYYQKFCYFWLSAEAENTGGDLLRKVTTYKQLFLYAFHFPLEDTVEDFLLVWNSESHPSKNVRPSLEGPSIFWNGCCPPLTTGAIGDSWLAQSPHLIESVKSEKTTPTLNNNTVSCPYIKCIPVYKSQISIIHSNYNYSFCTYEVGPVTHNHDVIYCPAIVILSRYSWIPYGIMKNISIPRNVWKASIQQLI